VLDNSESTDSILENHILSGKQNLHDMIIRVEINNISFIYSQWSSCFVFCNNSTEPSLKDIFHNSTDKDAIFTCPVVVIIKIWLFVHYVFDRSIKIVFNFDICKTYYLF
jgi:hypothetical protein